jgi:hypothetical protein
LYRYRLWGGNTTSTRFETQEAEANRILRELVRSQWRIEITAREAAWLRGIVRNEYPQSIEDLCRTSELIERLLNEFRRTSWASDKHHLIARDASVKLWLLAALARRHPMTSARLARAAWRTSPRGLPDFVAKVVRVLAGRTGRRSGGESRT